MCDFTGVFATAEKALILESLAQGNTLQASLAERGELPAVDRACLAAGEKSGHLPRVLSHLSQSHERWARAKRKTIGQLLYPIFLLHAAAFLLAVPDALSGGGSSYLGAVVGNLAIFYAAGLGLALFLRWVGNGSFAGAFYSLPVVGRFRRDLEIARFCMAFQHLSEAGVEIVESYRSSCLSLQSPYHRERLLSGIQVLRRGEPMTAALRVAGVMQSVEMQILETGEKTGMLGEAWGRLEAMLRERGENGLSRFTFWLTQAVHVGVLLWCALRILGFYFDYYRQLDSITR